MEEFFDLLLWLLLVIILGLTGLLIYFSFHAPFWAYVLIGILTGIFAGGAGFLFRRILRKRKLGDHYPLYRSITSTYKNINNAFRRLDRHAKNSVNPLLPGLKKLQEAAKTNLWKIYDIEKTLRQLESKHQSASVAAQANITQQQKQNRTIESHQRYYEHIRTIEASKARYLQEIQETLQFLESFHAQLITLRYSQNGPEVHPTMSETLDELLLEMKAFDEVK